MILICLIIALGILDMVLLNMAFDMLGGNSAFGQEGPAAPMNPSSGVGVSDWMQHLLPLLLAQSAPFLTKLVSKGISSMGPGAGWIMTTVLSALVSVLGPLVGMGGMDPVSSGILGTSLALSTHASMQTAPIKKEESSL